MEYFVNKIIFRSVVLAALASSGVFALSTVMAQPTQAPVIVIAQIDVQPEHVAELRSTMIALAAAARTESGCLDYKLNEDRSRPGRFFTYETWKSDEALKAHFLTPAMKTAGAKFKGALINAPIISRLSPL